MNIKEAEKIVQSYVDKSILSPDEEFMMIEALEYLIEKTKDTGWMVDLGGYYYGQRQFDLALKYYEMADSYGDKWAAEGLGYIWYYGRTGEKDYEKAFKYYSKAADNGYLKSKIKVADMYKNGYGVERDFDKYRDIVEEVCEITKDYNHPFAPKPEAFTRLARIRKDEGKIDEAVSLYLEAKKHLAKRIRLSGFFGDLNIMKWLVEDLYTMIDVDTADLDLFDLYYVLREPIKVSFLYEGEEQTVESVKEEGGISIKFNDTWYRDVDDFFKQADIEGERVSALARELYAFKIVR